MGQKDIISKQIFKRIFIDVATYIFHLELDSVELIETEQQRIEDRRADLTAKVIDSSGEPFILHIEIQNQNQKAMPDRMLRYLSDLRLSYPDETVYQYLLYIGKEALTMSSGITTPQLEYHYHVIDMHDIDYRFFMQQNTADALVLAILCDFKGVDSKVVVHEVLSQLMAILKDDNKAVREYVSMLEILASNRHLNLDIQQEFDMLEIEIEKLPSYLMGEKRGEMRGEMRGEIRGEKRGEIRSEKKWRNKEAELIAKQLFKLDLSIEKIAQATGIKISELEKIKQNSVM